MTTETSGTCANMASRVDLPTPVPAKIPMRCPAQIGMKASMALMPVRSGCKTRLRSIARGGSAQQPAVAGNVTAKPPSNSAGHPVRPSSNEQNELLPEKAAETSEGRAKPQAVEPDMSLARQYCRVVGNDALAAKLAEERRRAEDLKHQIEANIGELELLR